jgi:hypothetical protein
MKTTNNYNKYLHPDLIEIRRLNCKKYNNENREKLKTKNQYNYYKIKYGENIVNEFIEKYGNDAKLELKKLKKLPNII